jgi:hypothetical protein
LRGSRCRMHSRAPSPEVATRPLGAPPRSPELARSPGRARGSSSSTRRPLAACRLPALSSALARLSQQHLERPPAQHSRLALRRDHGSDPAQGREYEDAGLFRPWTASVGGSVARSPAAHGGPSTTAPRRNPVSRRTSGPSE